MRKSVLLLGLGLTVYLVAAARLDPALPFLFASGRLTWWCHPEPLATLADAGPHRLTFHFTPARAGRLEIAAMSRFRLHQDGELRAASGNGSWKRVSAVAVGPSPVRVEVEDPRWMPALGLGGEAAPGSGVGVAEDGVLRDAQRARARFAVAAALPDRQLALAVALLVTLLAAAALLALRPPATPATSPPPARARPPWLAALLLAHLALVAWNTARYPIERGLDAVAHVAYARAILDERALPPPDAGFQTYHPPLYHALGALALAATGSERALQWLSALSGILLVVLVARFLPPGRIRGLALVAFAPVLLVAEPQATNEVLLALLATAALGVAAAGLPGTRRGVAAGLLAGLALLTRYTGVFVLAGVLVALAGGEPGGPSRRRRATAGAAALLAALVVGGGPYLARWLRYGDPFIGNWDDVLGHPYRQPPGFRMAAYFLRFGASLVAHPFRAREGSLWDSLYVSIVGDGFGRFLNTPLQHVSLFLLAWSALPLLLVTLWGYASFAFHPGSASRGERAGLVMTLLALTAVVRYNLELPYWSAAKGVFLLFLVLPVAAAFERGRDAAVARGGPQVAAFLDAALVVFVGISVLTFSYRG